MIHQNLILTAPFNSLPNGKILHWSKFKTFADDKFKVAKMMIFVLDRVENIVGKGENAGYQHFSFSHNVFKRLLSWGSLKVGIAW